jgi:hypothetical protein
MRLSPLFLSLPIALDSRMHELLAIKMKPAFQWFYMITAKLIVFLLATTDLMISWPKTLIINGL